MPEPALDANDWGDILANPGESWVAAVYGGAGGLAGAAYCLHVEQHFTWADVDGLAESATTLDAEAGSSEDDWCATHADALRALAGRIAALLPPREMAHAQG